VESTSQIGSDDASLGRRRGNLILIILPDAEIVIEIRERGHGLVLLDAAQAVELALGGAARVLEPKWHFGSHALIAERKHPIRVSGSRFATTLVAHNHPINAIEVNGAKILEERFD
jgi:hypothetical protein